MTAGEVHVWQIPLHPAAAADDGAFDAQERRRAAAFKFDADRQRFIAAHAALRIVLSRYAGAAPGELRIDSDADGKPYLQGSAWQFNLSHSEDLALLAVARDGAIGVDVEKVRPLGGRRGASAAPDADEALALAERHYSPAEVNHLRELSGAERNTAFFHCWTRKEAHVKAIGTGIFTDLRAIHVGFDGSVRAGKMLVRSLALDSVWTDDGFVAALASAGEEAPIRLLRYPQDLAGAIAPPA